MYNLIPQDVATVEVPTNDLNGGEGDENDVVEVAESADPAEGGEEEGVAGGAGEDEDDEDSDDDDDGIAIQIDKRVIEEAKTSYQVRKILASILLITSFQSNNYVRWMTSIFYQMAQK